MNRFTSDQVYRPPRRIVSVKAKAYGEDLTCAFAKQYMNSVMHNFS